jgi:hypothetical protein
MLKAGNTHAYVIIKIESSKLGGGGGRETNGGGESN